MNKKLVYIAHPISGNIEENLKDLIRILRIINTNSHPILNMVPDSFYDFEYIIPLAPYYADILALDDNNPEERARGIENDIALIKTGVFDELWLTGNKISFGMNEEIKLFQSLNKPVINYVGKI